MKKDHIVVLTGAGMSAESGLKTFRDHDGLWENHSVYDVATPEAFQRDPDMVQRFYNMRRAQLETVQPNAGHFALVKAERHFDVTIITQNIDDLHERAGSSKVLHLHGELTKARSSNQPDLIVNWGYGPIENGDKAEDGSPLRPHVVWFGEPVPAIEQAVEICRTATHLLVVGTSLVVYPAAGLVHETPQNCRVTLVDPGDMSESPIAHARHVQKPAGQALPSLIDEWILNGVV
ncbi:MAG: NAD-dependent deacylase [Bacteroidetes bacterium]|nr:MAG: NAD-dependent deacylase [Bacteroidota bacterium]